MLTQEVIDLTVARIALMPFFPSSDSGARGTVSKEIADMATSDEQVKWLGHRFIQLYPKQWPGISEMRACFCKRFKPADGVQVNSAIYEEGFPTEAALGEIPGLKLKPALTERQAIEAGKTRLLQDGQQFSVDSELESLIHELAESARMPAAQIERRTKEEIERDLYRPSITAEEAERARAAELERRQNGTAE